MLGLLTTATPRYLITATAFAMFSLFDGCSGSHAKTTPTRTTASFHLDCSAATNGAGTQSAPWNALASVNSFTFTAGDKLLLNRGTTCNGVLNPQGSGSSTAPVVIDAYGTGAQPIIDGGTAEEAVKLFNQQYWEINNLEIAGGNLYGVYISGNAANSSINHIHLKNLDVHGAHFTSLKRADSGEVVIVTNGTGQVLNDILVDGVIAHDSHVSEGIFINAGGAYTSKNGTGQTLGNNVTVQNSIAHDIYGDGILISELTNGLLQMNVVYNSGLCPTCTGSTPVGLWEWYCHTCTVQNNESYANQSWGGDGGDFDIDYYNDNNVVQYNYGHDSAGYCVSVFSAGGGVSHDNIFRYNICSNNARRADLAANEGDVFLYTWDNGSLDGVQIYNNTFYWNPAGPGALLNSSAASYSGTDPLFFKNNIIYSTASEMIQSSSSLKLDNNIYWTTSSSPTWQVDANTYTDFAAYKSVTNQDAHSRQADPRLATPTYHETGKPTTAFHLLTGSPALAAGANVCAGLTGCSMGTKDFWGNALPAVSGFNIGAYQGPASPSQASSRAFRLRDQAGPVLLAFLQTVPDAGSTASRNQAVFLQSMQHQFAARGLRIAILDSTALATHASPPHAALMNASYDWHLEVPLLEDRDQHLARDFHVTQLPTLILLAPNGSIANRWQGFTPAATLAPAIEKLLQK